MDNTIINPIMTTDTINDTTIDSITDTTTNTTTNTTLDMSNNTINDTTNDTVIDNATRTIPATPTIPATATATATRKVVITKRQNRNANAGGKNTNEKGKAFENKTENETKLLGAGYEKIIINKVNKYAYYLKKVVSIGNYKYEINYMQQSGLKFYMLKHFNIEMIRFPDEAYIIKFIGSNDVLEQGNSNIQDTNKIIIKILEKKEQCVEGSAETKFWSAPSLKKEYEILLGNRFIVEYGLCVNDFLKKKFTMSSSDSSNKKYEILNQILLESNIDVLYGDDSNYLDNLNTWITKIKI